MSNRVAPHSEPRPTAYRTFTDDESLVATPTHRAVKTAALPSASMTRSRHEKPLNFSNPMFHLDSNGYPTRALYYLHKRLLDVLLHPTPSRNFILTTPPRSPVFTLPAEDDQLVHLSEQTKVLHHLCATIISRDYIRPPTPPVGASPCHTPPVFEHLAAPVAEHDETACRVARLLVQSNSCDVGDVDMLDMLEVELELEVEMGCATPKAGADTISCAWSCPSTIQRVDWEDKENFLVMDSRNKRTFLEEMEGVVTPYAKVGSVVKAPASEERRKEKQARRRVRNSLNGTRELRI